MSKRTGKTLSVGDKVKLIQEIDAKVCMKKDVAKKYGIPCSTLSTIYKNRDRILKFARQGTETESSRKRVKLGKFPQLEEEVYKWILNLSGRNKTLPGTTIRKGAQWLAEKHNYQGFQASVGWLEKFRARYNLKKLRKNIVLPTEARSLPDSGSVGNEGSILPGNSTEGGIFLESSPGGAVPQESSPDHQIPCITIKKEPIFPYKKCLRNPPCPKRPDGDYLWLLSASLGPPLRRGTASEEIMHLSSDGISGNQPTTEPNPHGSSEFRPTDVTPSDSGAHTNWSELANASSASSSDFVRENRSGNLTSLISTNQPKDQLECFGNYIVSKLKVMDSRTCLMVQKAINDTIFDAEIRALETVATDNARSSNGNALHLI